MNKDVIHIYTDGACSGNPGAGGWGAVLLFPNDSQENISGQESMTTNNRMELIAVVQALKSLNEDRHNIVVYTDSKYVKMGITEWIHGWRRNGWKTASKKAVKNKDLWISLYEVSLMHNITWEWVKGHDGNIYNEKADILARNAIIK